MSQRTSIEENRRRPQTGPKQHTNESQELCLFSSVPVLSVCLGVLRGNLQAEDEENGLETELQRLRVLGGLLHAR